LAIPTRQKKGKVGEKMAAKLMKWVLAWRVWWGGRGEGEKNGVTKGRRGGKKKGQGGGKKRHPLLFHLQWTLTRGGEREETQREKKIKSGRGLFYPFTCVGRRSFLWG